MIQKIVTKMRISSFLSDRKRISKRAEIIIIQTSYQPLPTNERQPISSRIMMSIRRKVESLAMRTPIQIFHTKLTTSRFITTSSRRPLLNTSSSQFTDGALRRAVPRLSSVVGSITSQTPAFSSLVVSTTRGMHTNLVFDEKKEFRVMSPEELEQKINRFKVRVGIGRLFV